MINLVKDALIHSLIAIVWSGFGGALFHLVGIIERPFNYIILVLGIANILSCILYWALREIEQHDGKFGGLKSQLEWILPSLSVLPGLIIGFKISEAVL